MKVLFQAGVPDIFFPLLEKAGCRIFRFATETARAHDSFREHRDAAAVFFRANFAFGATEADLLPALRLAALVSTGTDNVDAAALQTRGIRLTTGEGANAQAVFDYVIQALLCGGFNPEVHSVGVVGAGRVGSRLLRFLRSVGGRTAYYDPLLPEPGSLGEVLQCDFVTFHTELTKTGPHKTAGMLDAAYFAPAHKKIRVIQTCRGGIWNPVFYRTFDTTRIELLAQDVYPQEPPAAADVQRARYATPHIAGYSTRGRLGGILKGIEALAPGLSVTGVWPQGRAWFLDTEAADFMRRPADFSAIRDGYFWRKEFDEYDAAERAAFRARFPGIADDFFAGLFGA
ncbi:MAG: hypothetical protein J0L53_13585 [Spirochaetes bacterium]|nr:hypothetical protein [Spirochaetota bacterium]